MIRSDTSDGCVLLQQNELRHQNPFLESCLKEYVGFEDFVEIDPEQMVVFHGEMGVDGLNDQMRLFVQRVDYHFLLARRTESVCTEFQYTQPTTIQQSQPELVTAIPNNSTLVSREQL
jgi:hypothetical protein